MHKNKQLFEHFIMQNLDGAYRFAYSYVKNPQDAEDIVSQSIIKALSAIQGLRNPEFMKSWFYRIMINTANSYLKSKSKIVYLENEEWEMLQNSTDTYEDIDLKEKIDRLPPVYREIIVLRFFEDFTLKEIAETLGQNLNTVKTRLYKALKLIKVELEDDDEPGIQETKTGI